MVLVEGRSTTFTPDSKIKTLAKTLGIPLQPENKRELVLIYQRKQLSQIYQGMRKVWYKVIL